MGLGEAYNRWIYRLRERHFLALASKYGVEQCPRVADVGLGNGFYVELYQRIGVAEVCGVDISEQSIVEAKHAFPHYRFEVCDISQGFPESLGAATGFDWVSAMDMLYHIIEDDLFALAVEHCGRAVKSGGHLVVSDNFPDTTLPTTPTQAFHSYDDYWRVLEPLGFELVEISPVFFLSNGQVGNGGLGYSIAKTGWRTFARGLAKSLRTFRPVGEAIGTVTGAMLTGADTLLQHQRVFSGYSTKVAVFRRR